MEKSSAKSPRSISLRNKIINILLPGHFSYIHSGHRLLIQEIKSSFKKVSLTVGIFSNQSAPSILTDNEKIETFKSIPEIDKILILHSSPTESELRQWNIDLIATASKDKYSNFDSILRFEKRVDISSDDITARIIRDYDNHISNLVNLGFHRSSLGISKLTELSVKCKQQLKSIKKSLWNSKVCPKGIESALDKCRKAIQDTSTSWCDRQEQILRTWLGHSSTGVNILQRLLNDIWDSA